MLATTRLPDVFQTFSRYLQEIFKKMLDNSFTTNNTISFESFSFFPLIYNKSSSIIQRFTYPRLQTKDVITNHIHRTPSTCTNTYTRPVCVFYGDPQLQNASIGRDSAAGTADRASYAFWSARSAKVVILIADDSVA